jgi:chitodextrinase
MGHRTRLGKTALIIVALALLALALATPTAFAAASYTGGADDYPLFVANDYTASAIHFTASGLTPSTAYYVKVRFAVGPGPSGTTNRGWTWNPTSGLWVQERDDWTVFPQVTTDGAGAIGASVGWVYAVFGDTTKTGTYYILVSLSTGTAGETLNGTLEAPTTVMDMTASGAWVHNGVATGVAAAKRAEADDAADSAKVLALSKTETNGVDDDGNGVVDDEDYGPAGSTGDFRFAVPLAHAFSIALGSKTPWAPAQNVTLAAPDVDIALGAADQTPPSAPTGLAATPHNGSVGLAWTAATDGVTASPTYTVYRWTDAVPIGGATQYTPRPQLVGTTTATSWTDTNVVNQTKYYYLVRAEDAATNVGPRSNQVDATPDGSPPGPVSGLTADAGDAQVVLSWTNPTDADLAAVVVTRNADHDPAAPGDGTDVFTGMATTCTDNGLANGTTYHYGVFARDEAGNVSTPATASATPKGSTSLTFAAKPATLTCGAPVKLSGKLVHGLAEGLPGRSVTIERSYDGLAWLPLTTVTTSSDPAAGEFTFSDTPVRKTWYRATFAGDATFLSGASASAAVSVKVSLSTPNAPKVAQEGRGFTAYGFMKPRHTAGGHAVYIQCYRKTGGVWKLVKTVKATNKNYSTYTKYVATVSLPSDGSWRLRAYAPADSRHVASYSANYDYITVR